MKRDKWVWMPHAGHFICGYRCQFKLNTWVGGYIVSTVGEMPKIYPDNESAEFDEIGCNRKYETMVFKAKKSKNKCCAYEIIVSKQVDMEPYNSPEDATIGHLKLCKKWAKESKPASKREG